MARFTSKMVLMTALASLACVSYANAQMGELLYRGTARYGWSHKGVESWGGNWQVRAKNEALEAIRTRIASMVNWQQFYEFTGKNHASDFSGSGWGTAGAGGGSIKYAQSMNRTQQQQWVNRNNYLIDILSIRAVPGTAYSKTTSKHGKRKWIASLQLEYTYAIYGLHKGGPNLANMPAYTVWIENKTSKTIVYQLNGKTFVVESHHTRSHTQQGNANFQVNFDNKPKKDGYQGSNSQLAAGARYYFKSSWGKLKLRPQK